MQARFSSLTKVFVTWLCLISWLEASNYCALSSVMQRPQKEDCCEAKPSKKPGVLCCQVLQSIQQSSIKAKVVFSPECLVSLAVLVDFFWPGLQMEAQGFVHTGDPPPAARFGMVDLQRCHPAFAPPLV